MALDWVKKVDGVDVFPKLPVYLRTYYATWTRNQAAKNAVEQAKPATALLQQVIEKTRHKHSDEQEEGGSGQPAPAAPKQYELMQQPKVVVVEPEEPRIVGGVSISVPPSTGEAEQQQQQPSGGGAAQADADGGSRKGRGDLKKRKPKTCKRCKKNGGDNSTTAVTCKGRAPNGTCEYWTAEGKAVAKRK